MSLMNGFSEMGKALSAFGGNAAIQQQKSDLEKQQILLADQLKGGPQDREAKNLALIPQRLSIDTYLKSIGHPGGLADFEGAPAAGSGGGTGIINSASAAPRVAASGEASGNGTASGAPAPASGGSASPGEQAQAGGAPVVTPIGDKGKVLGIPLPPGWTPQMAAIAGPEKLSAAWAEFAKPGVARPGTAITYYNFATGQMDSLYQQPNTPPGYLYDAKSKSYVQIGGGLAAVKGAKTAEASGTSQGELPAKEEFAGFQKGLEMGTNLVDSYDPDTQTTTKVTQADALKRIRAGGSVNVAPTPGAPGPKAEPVGLQKDGSYKTPEGTTIPAPPKIDNQAGGFQTEPSAAQKATQSTYAETVKGWNDSVLPAAQSEQRFLAMAQALKAVQSGAWATSKAAIARNLIAAGMDTATADKLLKTDPSEVQVILKNNFGAALTTLSASKLGRITQNEIFAQQKNLSNPDLQPEANLEIAAQGVGIARFQQRMADDWNTASKLGYNDPLAYQSAWIKANPIQKFIDQARTEIGPLKGMTGAPAPGAYTWTPNGLVPKQ